MNSTTTELNLLELLWKGGVVIVPIIILSIVSVYLIIERWQSIRKKGNPSKVLIPQLNDQLQSGNIKAAIMLCERDQSASAQVLLSGLKTLGKPISEIESMMESAAQIEIAEMERKMNYLGLIAGIAPMLGFIGTISGVIKIFYNISLSDNISIGIIAGGLYEKMVSSGAGLVVGVIAYAGYHLLIMLIDKNVLQMQKQSFEFMKIIQQPSYENQKK
ncbi:MAG: MotA/TolQ/ExbB proton channel family protein [Bacteroidetes bacterium]|nr:MAG: MotA/TolQ/ExbB proton channel family protein [Bacteroidota bacterium]